VRMFIPKLWVDALNRSILNELRAMRKQIIWEAHRQLRKDHQRTRRQHRAAFRRRKRGLA